MPRKKKNEQNQVVVAVNEDNPETMPVTKTIRGFKGFDKDFRCRGFQFDPKGGEYQEKEAKICSSGFHFCTNPFDVFSYYPPVTSRFAEVEALTGKPVEQHDEDSKIATTHLKIHCEIDLKEIINACASFLVSLVKKKATTGDAPHSATTGDAPHSATTGDRAHSATTGDRAHSATTGYRAHSATTGHDAHSATTGYAAHSATTGYRAHSATTGDAAHSATTGDRAHSATTGDAAHSAVAGKNSIAVAVGISNKAKGKLACWLTLAEWIYKGNEYQLVCVKSILVDGAIIKEDCWYELKNGEFKEVDE